MNIYQNISSNKRKTAIFVGLFIGLVLAIAYVLGQVYYGSGYGGVIGAGIAAFVLSLISYFSGDKIALATAGAQAIEKDDAPYVWRMVENLAITAGLPMPKVYIIDDPAMNAFATGRDPEHASIALTTGIIQQLENEELEAVLAHEMSHIGNYDIRLMMIVAMLAGMIVFMTDIAFRMSLFGGDRRSSSDRGGNQAQVALLVVGIVLMILAPIIAQIMKLAISRKREFLADASGVLLTRYPQALASALEKIGRQDVSMRRANNATAHLFLVNPFAGQKKLAHLFSTHPPIEERVARLREMGGQSG